MESFWEFLKKLTDPESILNFGGLALLLTVIFAETGLLIGFFLPGDSLVFISGLFCAVKPQYVNHVSIHFLLLLMMSAAILGNTTGFWFGKKAGEKLFTRDDNLIFKKRYLSTTESFYQRHGNKALILGRFFPIIRTFAPILAGAIKMNFMKFMLLNFAGAFLWIGSICSIGYYLGSRYPETEKHLGKIILIMLVLTTIPVVKGLIKRKNR
ncbi:MAG: DedA family protein [Bacteroidota bacterium]|jgi:membrane-associated protein